MVGGVPGALGGAVKAHWGRAGRTLSWSGQLPVRRGCWRFLGCRAVQVRLLEGQGGASVRAGGVLSSGG